jgi:NAD(P)-dependent dehydrogenase (short-subunit alcohol dehydrogenase family)
MDKIVLVTGASSGIGKETVMMLLKEGGYKVYAAARRIERMADIEEQGAIAVKLDVTDRESSEKLIDRIIAESGGLDILVNNAGYGSLGSIEDVPVEEAKKQFEVNVFGLSLLIQKVLPVMRKKGKGLIINVSSVGGKMSIPLGGWYHSTKFAVEGLSNSLRMEVKPFGIDVVLIEPGPIISEWSKIATDNMIKTSGEGAYKEMAVLMSRNFGLMYHERHTSKSSTVAKSIMKAIKSRKPRTRYPTGRYAGIILFSRKIMCDRLFDKVVSMLIKDSAILRYLSNQFKKNEIENQV